MLHLRKSTELTIRRFRILSVFSHVASLQPTRLQLTSQAFCPIVHKITGMDPFVGTPLLAGLLVVPAADKRRFGEWSE